MILLARGGYRARLAQSPEDVSAGLELRSAAFRDGAGDCDAFDAACDHALIETEADGRLVGYFRLLPLGDGRAVDQSYSAQFYGLSGLASYRGNMLELGRFCIDPSACTTAQSSADVLRMTWAALAAYVDRKEARMIFGCSSFEGMSVAPYRPAFGLLRDRYIGPAAWRPVQKAAEVVHFDALAPEKPDFKAARSSLPPLLQSYLAMGGWVSDHAVIDRDLGTLHVFTALEIGSMPPARLAVLRALLA
ncbi:MAG: GNAT family N-acyltransferase [Pseudomonadota bacterium]